MEQAMEANPKPRKPSTAFLVTLNALVFLALLFPSFMNPFNWFIAIPGAAIFLTISGIWQAIWVYLDRRFHFHNFFRCSGFVLPVTVLFALSYLGVEPALPINKQRPAVSETGQYKAYVHANFSGWTVDIQDQNGIVLRNEQTDLLPHLNVYWIWGPNEQLWLYNSDDSEIHCRYAKSNGIWKHVLWGYGDTQKTNMKLGSPPENLYPDYVRNTIDETEQTNEPELE